MSLHGPALRGALLALLAAALFGLSTPLVQWFGRGVGAFSTAALLYLGAALAALVWRSPAGREATLRRSLSTAVLAWRWYGETHEHEHAHEALEHEHEHAHTHDDGHHLHRHDPMPEGAHSHAHRHDPLRHAHPHVPDAHHRHSH